MSSDLWRGKNKFSFFWLNVLKKRFALLFTIEYYCWIRYLLFSQLIFLIFVIVLLLLLLLLVNVRPNQPNRANSKYHPALAVLLQNGILDCVCT